MSYRDLQSTAKEIGIPANQSHEEMIDDIVEHFADKDADSES